MPGYAVNHRYVSYRDGKMFGPFEPGTTVELEAEDADWVNRDSPGCLTALVSEPAAEVAPDGEAEPARDRQHRGGRKRAG